METKLIKLTKGDCAKFRKIINGKNTVIINSWEYDYTEEDGFYKCCYYYYYEYFCHHRDGYWSAVDEVYDGDLNDVMEHVDNLSLDVENIIVDGLEDIENEITNLPISVKRIFITRKEDDDEETIKKVNKLIPKIPFGCEIYYNKSRISKSICDDLLNKNYQYLSCHL